MDPESKSKLPPMTMSTVVPALPESCKNVNGGWHSKIMLAAILVFAGGGLCFLFSPEPEIGEMIIAATLIVMFALTMVSTWKMKQLMTEREAYERRLQEMAYTLVEKNSSLKQLVHIDPLTQLLNRRGLERALSVEVNRARRKNLQRYAVLLDCDDFKQVNESFGHAVGDLVLQNMAVNIFRSVRPTDYASRVGGDEFIVFLIDIDEVGATTVAERIRANIADSPALHNGKAVLCTASLGAAELPPEIETIEEMLTITRQALKSSKTSGKNSTTLTGLQKSI